MTMKNNYQKQRDKYLMYKIIMIAIDLLLVVLSTYLALKIRFDFRIIPLKYMLIFGQSLILNLLIHFMVFWLFKLYNTL